MKKPVLYNKRVKEWYPKKYDELYFFCSFCANGVMNYNINTEKFKCNSCLKEDTKQPQYILIEYINYVKFHDFEEEENY